MNPITISIDADALAKIRDLAIVAFFLFVVWSIHHNNTKRGDE